jgi:hypothetical protein
LRTWRFSTQEQVATQFINLHLAITMPSTGRNRLNVFVWLKIFAPQFSQCFTSCGHLFLFAEPAFDLLRLSPFAVKRTPFDSLPFNEKQVTWHLR